MAFVYRFKDTSNNILYYGKTSQSMDSRMSQHFGGKGHLSKQAYNSVAQIDYMKLPTESDALIMETYLITRDSPKFNKLQQSRDIPSIQLEEGKWKLYRQIKPMHERKIINTGIWKFIAFIYLIIIILYYFL